MIALEEIKEGEFVHEYVGEIIDEQEVARRLQLYQATGVTDYYIVSVSYPSTPPRISSIYFFLFRCYYCIVQRMCY